MKRSPLLLFVLLAAVFSFGRTVSDEEIARAVLRAVRSHPGMPNPDSVQLSNVVATNEGVCMEYRVTNAAGGVREGYAVYKTDKELVYIDNSWVWDSSCLAGKYGQRRLGKDITESVTVALEARKKAPAVSVASVRIAGSVPAGQISVVPKQTASKTAIPAVSTPVNVPVPASENVRLVAPAEVRTPVASVSQRPTAPAQISSVPVSSAPVVATTISAPTAQPIMVAAPIKAVSIAPEPAPIVHLTSAPIVIVETAPAVPAIVRPAVAVEPVGAPADAPTVEMGTVRGVTIADPYGALGKATPTAAGGVVQESLADAARRLKKAKQ